MKKKLKFQNTVCGWNNDRKFVTIIFKKETTESSIIAVCFHKH